MQIFFCFIIYIIGVLLGSFFTLAIYRIPRKQDIIHTRSYCPKCNHKLNFLDLIPVLSYIFLKGKCRYCHEKIGSRYIVIEAISGVIYLLFILSFKINILSLNIKSMLFLILITIFYSIIIIFAGIEKETKQTPNKIIIFSFIYEIIYITYLYMLNINIYRYIIYLIITFILLLLLKVDKIKVVKIIFIAVFSTLLITNIVAWILTLINSILMILINFIKERKILPVFSISAINLIILIISNFIN